MGKDQDDKIYEDCSYDNGDFKGSGDADVNTKLGDGDEDEDNE